MKPSEYINNKIQVYIQKLKGSNYSKETNQDLIAVMSTTCKRANTHVYGYIHMSIHNIK